LWRTLDDTITVNFGGGAAAIQALVPFHATVESQHRRVLLRPREKASRDAGRRGRPRLVGAVFGRRNRNL
jgi:hypothetical protein